MKYSVKFKGIFECEGIDKAYEILEKIAKELKFQIFNECEIEYIKPMENQKLTK